MQIDYQLLKQVTEDARGRNNLLTVNDTLWGMQRFFPDKFSQDGTRREIPTFEEMMVPWVGAKMLEAPTDEEYGKYASYIMELGEEKLLGKTPIKTLADLSTLIDLTLIRKYTPFITKQTKILEIGGGYGRVAEAVFKTWPAANIKYVMVDAVPITLVYAYQHMKTTFPERKIALYQPKLYQDFTDYDCIIVPAWHFEIENTIEYDLAICIASMQEMEQEQINYYIELLNKVVRYDGVIYLFNSRDYFRREFKYPSNWRILQMENTPKSLSPHFPAEIFFKSNQDATINSLRNSTRLAEYNEWLYKAYRDAYYKKFDHVVRLVKKIERLEASPMNRLVKKVTGGSKEGLTKWQS